MKSLPTASTTLKVLLAIGLLAAGGVVASLFLVPRQPEMALIYFKDKEFEKARAAYEAQAKGGSVGAEAAGRLADLYLQSGSIDQAIQVMEEYVAASPADAAARRRLGELYQYAQRPDDHLRNLEELNRLSPTPQTLVALSQIYNFTGQYEKQADALKALLSMQKDAEPHYYIDLANILAARKSNAEAVDALKGLKENHPQSFTFREEELLVSLLLDEKRGDEAYQEALAWRNRAEAKPQETARLVNLLHFKGAPSQAAQLIDTYDTAAIDADPALLEEKILLLLDNGEDLQAYDRLKTLYAQDKLSPELRNRLLFLAIAHDDAPLAGQLLKGLDFSALNESQALALLELSLSRGDNAMQKQLAEAFDTADTAQNAPLLSAMLSLTGRKPDAREKLDSLAEADLSAGQNLQVARICARLRDFACSTRFLSRLPAGNELSDADVAAVGNLFLDMRAYDKGYAFIRQMADARPNSSQVQEVRVKYAAQRGETAAVNAWLGAHAETASTRTLTDLFFLARNNRQLPLAARLAEILYAREQTPATRSYLAGTYVSAGQYAKAVALLRESRQLTAADESNYLTALTKLAQGDESYRQELGRFAASRLNADLPYERKMALIYALVQADQAEIAMPYIRVLALKNGGQWAALYANLLDKQGRHDEAREFWVALANQPSTPPAQRRQIAYNLIAGGYARDAEPLFRAAAENAGAGSQEMRELLYLWGPRLSDSQLDWLAERYDAAPDTEKPQWAEIIAASATDRQTIALLETRHSDLLYVPSVMQSYLAAVARSGQWQEKSEPLFKGISESGDAALLRAYAQAAEANGDRRAAREAYETLFSRDPQDSDALRRLGILTSAQADYSTSETYLSEYLRGEKLSLDAPDHIAPASFYYAELLRRQGDTQQADRFYRQTLSLTEDGGLRDAQALSYKAQSLIRLGQVEEGLALFGSASQSQPGDDVLRADWIAALIDLKRYEEARTLLVEKLEPAASVPDLPPLPVPLETPPVENAREAILLFDASDADIRDYAESAQTLPWVAYTMQGYRMLLVVAKPGYTMTFAHDGDGQALLVPVPSPQGEAARQAHLRYELLAARVEVETGEVYAAAERLNKLVPDYPADAQLLGYTANVENYGGNPHRAQALLSVARNLAPENQDIALLDRDIRRGYAPNAKLDYEWVRRGDDTENITTLSGHANAGENLVVGLVAQNNHVKVDVLKGQRKPTGNRQRGELYALYHFENGRRLKASLFADNETLGAGGYFDFLNALGESGVVLEYRKPYWDLDASTVYFNYNRDRISFWHLYKPTPQWSLRLEPGYNHYNIAGDLNGLGGLRDPVHSWSVDASVVYRPVEQKPYFYFAYGLNYESYNRPLSINSNEKSREVHFISVNTGYEFTPDTYASALLGYGYDRAASTGGPLAEARLTHEFTDEWDAQMRAAYGFDTRSGGDDTIRLGGYLRYRF